MIGDHHAAVIENGERSEVESDIVAGAGGRIKVTLTDVGQGVGRHVLGVASDVVDGVHVRTFGGLVSHVEDEQIEFTVGLEFPLLDLRGGGVEGVGVI